MLLDIPYSSTQIETSEVRAYIEHPEPGHTYNILLTSEGVIFDVVDSKGSVVSTACIQYADVV